MLECNAFLMHGSTQDSVGRFDRDGPVPAGLAGGWLGRWCREGRLPAGDLAVCLTEQLFGRFRAVARAARAAPGHVPIGADDDGAVRADAVPACPFGVSDEVRI